MTEQQSSSAEAFKQVKNQVKISTPGISKPIVDKHFRFEAGVGIVHLIAQIRAFFNILARLLKDNPTVGVNH